MFLASMRVGTCLLLMVLGGCEPSWRAQFKQGAKLYDKSEQRYFGKVVGYEATHDFHNGTPPQAAILIETAEGSRSWGACSTCATTFEVKP